MRRFILCKGIYTNAAITAIEVRHIGVYHKVSGVDTLTKTGVDVKAEANIVLGRDKANGGNLLIPIHKNGFSYAKMEYKAHTAFTASITIPAPTSIGDYSIIIAKKGVNFNERNKWTATVHVSENDIEAKMTAAQLAEKLADAINGNNTVSKKLTVIGNTSSGVKATLNTATITITAVKAGVDYKVLTADNLMTVKPTETAATIGYGSADYIRELANKAAADAGFTDTFEEDIDMYKNYPLDPLAGDPTTDLGYTIFTLKFAEPRATKTVDQTINQIVQVAFITGSAGIKTFEDVCKGLAGEVTATTAE